MKMTIGLAKFRSRCEEHSDPADQNSDPSGIKPALQNFPLKLDYWVHRIVGSLPLLA